MLVEGIEKASLDIQTGILLFSHTTAVTDTAIKAVIGRSSFRVISLAPPSP